MNIQVLKLMPDSYLPTRATDGSAGYDLYARTFEHIPPGENIIVWLGIKVAFPRRNVALIWDRSSLGSKGIHRFAGVIDSDYRGDWGVILHNTTDEDYVIHAGDRIAQVLFQPVHDWPVVEVEELDKTFRGDSGLGSTGK